MKDPNVIALLEDLRCMGMEVLIYIMSQHLVVASNGSTTLRILLSEHALLPIRKDYPATLSIESVQSGHIT